jgi:hypothetical protein
MVDSDRLGNGIFGLSAAFCFARAFVPHEGMFNVDGTKCMPTWSLLTEPVRSVTLIFIVF